MFSSLKHSNVLPRLEKHSRFRFRFRRSSTAVSGKIITPSHQFRNPAHQALHHLLEKCSSMGELKFLHAQIIIHGLANENLTLGKLISFCAVAYAGDLGYAQVVFDRVLEPNKYMYNSLIRGFSNGDDPIKAISLYFRMINQGFSPNEFTLPFVIKACARLLAYRELTLVHGQAIKLGIGFKVCVQNALVNGYTVCGFLGCARKMFDDITDRTLVSWNSMIGGYSRMGFCNEAFLLFRGMRESGLEPDELTLVSLLSVCSKTCDLGLGRCVHLYIEISGMKIDQILRNALLDMYAKCGMLHSARTIFDRMPEKNVVSWTSMISGYAKHGLVALAREIFHQTPEKNVVCWNSMISCYVQEGRCKEALLLYDKMLESSVLPDEATLVNVLSGCSQIGDLVMGKKIHGYIRSNNFKLTVALSNALVDVYAKCGALGTAMDIFLKMPGKNVVSWNVIIGALALHGRGPEAVEFFNMMQANGTWPDEITFTGLLSACCHSGLVEMGWYHFCRMNTIYGLSPEIEHYACMIDLLGRGGFLDEAVRLVGTMPMRPDVVVWGALLGACRTHGHVNLGNLILKQLLETVQCSSGLYVLLSNIYSEAERWDDVKRIRKLMNDRGIAKCRAISFIEIDGIPYEFMVDDRRYESKGIHNTLDQLLDHLKSVGYSPNALLDVEEV